MAHVATPVAARAPPRAAEVAGYTGIHAAAHSGNLPALEKMLATSRSSLKLRDGYRRTALHVTTHAR